LNGQRKSLVTALRDLASSGKGVEDVEHVLSLDKSVRVKGSSLEEVAELNSSLGGLDLRRGEVGRLVTLSRELGDADLTPRIINAWMTLDEELVADGFNKGARRLISEESEKHGGVEKTLKAFKAFKDLGTILGESTRLEGEVAQLRLEADKLRAEAQKLDTLMNQRKEMIKAADQVSMLGFDQPTLTMIATLSEKHGGPYRVIDAIKKYPSITEMNEDLKAKKAESEKLKKEISENKSYLTVLNYTIKEAEKEHSRNRDVRQVVELLVNPRGIKMDRLEVVKLLTRVLDSGAQRIKESFGAPSVPSQALDDVYWQIIALTKNLKSISDEEADGP
jgi:predicted nuclease with TOPRIM domain